MPDELLTSDSTDLESGGAPPESTEGSDSSAAREYFDANKHIPKSEFTKLRQRDAAERQKFESEFQQRQQQLAAREQQLIQAALQIQQRMQGQGQQKDPYGRLREQPYVTGNDLAEIVQQLRDNDFGGIAQAIRQRDQALGMLHNRLLEVQKAMDAIQGKNLEAGFEGRLSTVKKELGLPDAPWATEFLKDVYLSHEGPDLNEGFADLARTRLEELRKAFRSMDKEAADKARKLPVLPGGGLATPGKALKDDKYKTPKQRADELFDAFVKDSEG